MPKHPAAIRSSLTPFRNTPLSTVSDKGVVSAARVGLEGIRYSALTSLTVCAKLFSAFAKLWFGIELLVKTQLSPSIVILLDADLVSFVDKSLAEAIVCEA